MTRVGALQPFDCFAYGGNDYMVLPTPYGEVSYNHESILMYNVYNITNKCGGCFRASTAVRPYDWGKERQAVHLDEMLGVWLGWEVGYQEQVHAINLYFDGCVQGPYRTGIEAQGLILHTKRVRPKYHMCKPFEDLRNGAVFVIPGYTGKYIKIPRIRSVPRNFTYNAYCIETGRVCNVKSKGDVYLPLGDVRVAYNNMRAVLMTQLARQLHVDITDIGMNDWAQQEMLLENQWHAAHSKEKIRVGYSFSFSIQNDKGKPKEKHEMSNTVPTQSHILALMQENMTTIGVRYANSPRTYSYKATLRQAEYIRSIVEMQNNEVDKRMGLAVVVPGSNGELKIAYAVSVDDEPQIDLDAPYEYKWIVSVVDTSEYDAMQKAERNARDVMRQAERKKRKRELVEQLGIEDGTWEEVRGALIGPSAAADNSEGIASTDSDRPTPTEGIDTAD